jgi:hypothetical protein
VGGRDQNLSFRVFREGGGIFSEATINCLRHVFGSPVDARSDRNEAMIQDGIIRCVDVIILYNHYGT